MIKVLRISTSGGTPYENVELSSSFLGGSVLGPNFFEDSQLSFSCKHGKFLIPDYNLVVVHVHKKRISTAEGTNYVKRIVLSDDLNYADCHVVEPYAYGKYGVPQIFREYEQLAFICKEGLFVTTDFHVQLVQLK